MLKQKRLSVKQNSRYPWDGSIRIAVNPETPLQFNLMLRIPEWSRSATVRLNGESVSTMNRVRGYAQIQRTWKPGGVVEVMLPMPVEPVKAHPLVEADAGKVALMRGPLVFCLESADNRRPVERMTVPSRTVFQSEYRPDLLNGVTVITGPARVLSSPAWEASLYASARDLSASTAAPFTAIPYYANANRGPVQMTVWLPEAV